MTIHQVILNTSSETLCLPFDGAQTTVGDVKAHLCRNYTDGLGALVVSSLGGKILADDITLFETKATEHLNLSLRLRGGKGGFGSMLRAQGGRMNAQKTTNFEACRDLQGRRIKSVNEAKRLEEELAALPKREQEKRERLEKKIEKALKEREPRKHLFDDHEFLDNREQMMEGVKNAVSGLLKRPHPSSSSAGSSSAAAGSSTSSTASTTSSSSSSSHSSAIAQSATNKRQKTQSAAKLVSVFDDEDDSDESDESDNDNDDEKMDQVPTPMQSKGKGKGPAVKSATIKV